MIGSILMSTPICVVKSSLTDTSVEPGLHQNGKLVLAQNIRRPWRRDDCVCGVRKINRGKTAEGCGWLHAGTALLSRLGASMGYEYAAGIRAAANTNPHPLPTLPRRMARFQTWPGLPRRLAAKKRSDGARASLQDLVAGSSHSDKLGIGTLGNSRASFIEPSSSRMALWYIFGRRDHSAHLLSSNSCKIPARPTI